MTRGAILAVFTMVILARPNLCAAQSVYLDPSKNSALELSLGESFHAEGSQHLAASVGFSIAGHADIRFSVIDQKRSEVTALAIGTRVLAFRQHDGFPASVFFQGDLSTGMRNLPSRGMVMSLGVGIARSQSIGGTWSIVPTGVVEVHSVFDFESGQDFARSASTGQTPITVGARAGRTRATGTASVGILYQLHAGSSVFVEPMLGVGRPDQTWGIRLGFVAFAP